MGLLLGFLGFGFRGPHIGDPGQDLAPAGTALVSQVEGRSAGMEAALFPVATTRVANRWHDSGTFDGPRSIVDSAATVNTHSGYGAMPALASPTTPVKAVETEFGMDGTHSLDFEIAAVDGLLSHTSGLPTAELVLHPVARITGDLSPKSVVASGTGLYFAQNMMYRHTISVFDHHKNLVATIDDSVDLREFGYDVPADVYRGAPVEAAFTSDGSFAFVSNYRMYGPGYDAQAGSDTCRKGQGQDSFVYRIDTTTLRIDHVYPVGPVPKGLAVTPDDRLLLVSNWCGFDVTVINLATGETLASVEVGRFPRGIAITGDSDTAYVALVGSTDIAVIDLSALLSLSETPGTLDTSVRTYIRAVGVSPRHLVLSPDDQTLYVTLNGEGAVVAVDLDSGQVIRRVRSGHTPRSMDISTDGTALYVVNYQSNTMSKIRTSDFTIQQEIETASKPIGITYDPFNHEVWVSTYSGVIHVYAEGQENPA